MRIGAVALCMVAVPLSGGPVLAGAAPTQPERAAVEAVVQAYAAGLRQADLAGLRSAFADAGQFIARNRDGSLVTAAFATVLPTWVSKPDDKVEILIDQVSMPTPAMAAITARLRTTPRCYDDQLLLYRGGDGWRIVAKTTEPWADCGNWPKRPGR